MNINKKRHDKDIWGSRYFSEGKSRPSVCLFYGTWIKGKPMKRIKCTFQTKGGGISILFMKFTSMRCSPEQVESESWKRARCLYVLFQVITEKMHMALEATLLSLFSLFSSPAPYRRISTLWYPWPWDLHECMLWVGWRQRHLLSCSWFSFLLYSSGFNVFWTQGVPCVNWNECFKLTYSVL